MVLERAVHGPGVEPCSLIAESRADLFSKRCVSPSELSEDHLDCATLCCPLDLHETNDVPPVLQQRDLRAMEEIYLEPNSNKTTV